jgi:hypothetical protein
MKKKRIFIKLFSLITVTGVLLVIQYLNASLGLVNLAYLANFKSQNFSLSFCVISVVFNPVSYHSRHESYYMFEKHIQSYGVRLITVELRFPNQTFHVTNKANTDHIQLETDDILWYKENLINIGIKRSPSTCQYISWIDTEVEFLNQNWVHDTIKALETDQVVQLFEVARWLNNKSETSQDYVSYGYCFKNKLNNLAKFYAFFNLTGVPWCSVGFGQYFFFFLNHVYIY